MDKPPRGWDFSTNSHKFVVTPRGGVYCKRKGDTVWYGVNDDAPDNVQEALAANVALLRAFAARRTNPDRRP